MVPNMVSIAEPIFGAIDEDAGPWRHGDAWVGVTHQLVDTQVRLGGREASMPNPWIVLWVSKTGIVDGSLVDSTQEVEGLARAYESATSGLSRARPGNPAAPVSLIVESPQVASKLKKMVAAGVPIRVGQTRALAPYIYRFASGFRFIRPLAKGSYFDMGANEPDLAEAMTALAEFHEKAVWNELPDREFFIGMTHPTQRTVTMISAYASGSRNVQVFQTQEDYALYRAAFHELAPGEGLHLQAGMFPRVEASFIMPIPGADRRNAECAPYTLPNGKVPSIVTVGSPSLVRSPRRSELRLLVRELARMHEERDYIWKELEVLSVSLPPQESVRDKPPLWLFDQRLKPSERPPPS